MQSLNRTSVGLKPRAASIKIRRKRSLNRTSVGLKQRNKFSAIVPGEGPQSNQRGIETTDGSIRESSSGRPQSNQRGIETLVVAVSRYSTTPCLNRTSVGLKHKPRDPTGSPPHASIELAWD